MNRPQRFTASQQPTFKLPAFQEDKRLAFVDSVCATLMTSRFGWGAMYTLNPRFRGTADEPFEYLSMLEEEPIGWHKAATTRRQNHLRKRVATRIGQVMLISGNGASFAFLGRDGPTLKPPAHAGGSSSRGSPTFFKDVLLSVCLSDLSELCVRFRIFHAKPAKDAKKTQNKSWDVGPTRCQTDLDL